MKSFRVFLHGNHLIAIFAWFVWQGFAQGEKCTGNRSEYRNAGPFEGIVTVAYFQVCEICLKMSSPIHLK